MTEQQPVPTLSYAPPANRRRKRTGVVIVTTLVVAAIVAELRLHRPVVQFGQRHVHSWRLPRAVEAARDVATKDDRAALTAAWRRMHTHRSGSLHGSGKRWRYAPTDAAGLLFLVERAPAGRKDEFVGVGLAENGVNELPYLFFESWIIGAADGLPDIAARHHVPISPADSISRLKFVRCDLDANHPDRVHVSYTVDDRRGVVTVDLPPNADAKVSADGWTYFGERWYPGKGEMNLQVAPPATWEVPVGRDFAGVRLPDNEHIEVAKAEPNEVHVFSIKGDQSPSTRQALTVLKGAEAALYPDDDRTLTPPAPQPIDVLARCGDVDFISAVGNSSWRPPRFRTSADGRLAAMADHTYAYVWSNSLPGVAYRFSYPQRSSMSQPGIALSADGSRLAVVSAYWQKAPVWDLTTLPGLSAPATRPAK